MTLRARHWLVLGVVLFAIAATAVWAWSAGGRAQPAPPPTVAVKRGDVTSSVAASGTVAPVATRELAFSMAGTLTSVSVKPGDTVAIGQTLAAIDPSAAQEALTQAKSTLAGAQQALAEAQAAAASPAPTRSGAPAQHSSKDALYSAEDAVTKAQRVLAGTTLRAPIAGKVLSVAGKAGDAAGTATFITLGVVEKMMVKAEFAEADAVTLAVGQKALVQLGSRAGVDFPATIAQVAAVGTVTDRLVRYAVLLAFDEPPADLLIGQSATAEIVINRAAGVLLMPQSAVLGSRVRRVDGAMKTVQTGLHGDGYVEITSGLAEGELVRLNAR